MPEGSRGRERMIASPRKICVPGVQACATAGMSTSARSTASATRPAVTARGDARVTPGDLNADALALTADRFPKIVELVLHDVVDRVARGVNVLAHLVDHVIDRDPVDQLLAAVDSGPEPTLSPRRRPTRSLSGAIACPPRPVHAATSGPLGSLHPGES